MSHNKSNILTINNKTKKLTNFLRLTIKNKENLPFHIHNKNQTMKEAIIK